MATTLTYRQIALDPVIAGLKNAHAFILKGEAHAKNNGVDPNDYLTASLAPDMFDLIKQVQRFTDTAKSIATRVNPDNPPFVNEDNETTYPQLLARINRTIEYLESISAKSFEGKEDVELTMIFGPVQVTYSTSQYIMQFAHPNFWFYVTTAYDILRHKGVPLGKMDYVNGAGLIELKPVQKKET